MTTSPITASTRIRVTIYGSRFKADISGAISGHGNHDGVHVRSVIAARARAEGRSALLVLRGGPGTFSGAVVTPGWWAMFSVGI